MFGNQQVGPQQGHSKFLNDPWGASNYYDGYYGAGGGGQAQAPTGAAQGGGAGAHPDANWWYHGGAGAHASGGLSNGEASVSGGRGRWGPGAPGVAGYAVDEDTAAVSPSSVTSGSEQHLQYETECPIFAMAHTRRHGRHRIAVGSYLLKEENKLQIVEETSDGRLVRTAEADIAYPVTKLMWLGTPDLLASTGHALRLWRYSPDDVSPHGGALGGLKEVATLHSQPRHTHAHHQQHYQQGDHQHHHLRGHSSTSNMLSAELPPLTSLHWSPQNRHKLGTSSVDTTCTIWNLEKQKIETQLIAHDRAVYDIAFSATIDSLFSSVGADGSVRLFDQKNLDHSTIIYESAEPLLRLAWSEFDTNLIAAVVAKESTGVIVLDIRKPSVALTHAVVPANSIAWVSRTHLLTADNNGMASIFDVSTRAVRPAFAMQDHTQPGVSPSQHHPHGGLPHMQQPLPPPTSFYNLRARTVLEYNLGRPALQASYSYRENAACISTGSSLEIVPLPPFLARDRGELGLGGVVAGVGGVVNPSSVGGPHRHRQVLLGGVGGGPTLHEQGSLQHQGPAGFQQHQHHAPNV